MPAYKVLTVDGPREWDWPKGSGQMNYDWSLRLEGVDKEVIWTKKSAAPPTAPGQMVELLLEPHKFDGKLKGKPPQSGGFGGGGGGSRQEDPGKQRSIAMQHAQKCAVDALRVAAEHGDYHPTTAGEFASQVKAVALVLWKQVQEAEKDSLSDPPVPVQQRMAA